MDYDKISISGSNQENLPKPDSFPDIVLSDPRKTHVKSEATKKFLKESWMSMFEKQDERKARVSSFRKNYIKPNMSKVDKEQLIKQFSSNETSISRMQRKRVSLKDFEMLKQIGRGGSGEIWLVKYQFDGRLYAMKIINKLNSIVSEQIDGIRCERNLLARIDNPWVVELFFAFQDQTNLYFVLEFIQGGDLFALLCRETTIYVDNSKFFVAEIALAIHSVHMNGFIHRDLKPDNILITLNGHIKLTDFGLSTTFEEKDPNWIRLQSELRAIVLGEDYNEIEKSYSIVGTVDYIAPEVLKGEEYDFSCDWWSLGVLAYELMFGCKPFTGSSITEIALNIIRWREVISYPSVPKLPETAIDFLRSLICESENRLTYETIKSHPFFEGFEWDKLLDSPGPYIPQVNSPDDLSAFVSAETIVPQHITSEPNDNSITRYAFLGFTYKAKKSVNPTPSFSEEE